MRLLFSTSDALSSRLIRLIDGGEASHVGLVIDGNVWDSTWRHDGVRCWTLNQWLSMDGKRVIDDITIPLPDERGAAAWAEAQEGAPYDRTGLIGFGFYRDWSEPSAWYCSEYALAAAQIGGLTMAGNHQRIGVRLLREIMAAHAQGAH